MIYTVYLTIEQVLIIHEDQIERYGGSSGLRDLALLESAIYRPQSTFGGKDLYPTVFKKTAVLVHSLMLNHPFIDGNKRTGMAAAMVFLELNKYILKVAQNELVVTALKIEKKDWGVEQISSWLSIHSKKV